MIPTSEAPNARALENLDAGGKKKREARSTPSLPFGNVRRERITEEPVSWIHRHLDTSSGSSPVSERRSEFRYTVALPRGAQLVNTTSVHRRKGEEEERERQGKSIKDEDKK